ncbi:DUF3108 domain-containing protein [Pelagibius marinus]|uniref:DUF3108 domain-containing protein n=1 Tax=Pelagibius marinus TaxID=2762760 RepID=UPI001872B73C|nr:DUF3108 domain-containing protein [Pelagibius marinus]
MRVQAFVLPVRRRLGPSGALAAASAGLLFGAALLTAGSARAEPASATYEIYFGGFHVLTATAEWEQGPEGYRIAGEAETQGMLGWMHPWKGETESRGLLAAGEVIPRLYETRGTSDEGEKLVRLSYDPEGDLVDSLVQPQQDDEERHPLPANAGDGTLDPLSVVAGLSELLRNGGRCEASFPVFDGRKRYDVFVSDAGEKVLEPTSYSIFAGTARGCRLDYKLLGGHRVERSKYAETARERIVWVARPQEGAPLLPVRLEIETAYGTVMGHLTGFEEDTQVARRSGVQTEDKLAQ